MAQSKVFMFSNDDPEMQAAYERARAAFRYFWREIAWDRRRIIPALDMACVKAAFADDEPAAKTEAQPEAEQMWISDVDFNGSNITGTLINQPNWVKSVQQGDAVEIPLEQITDWMYAIDGKVYGAFTVNLMRSRMSPKERKEHDAAWGLNFGDPAKARAAENETDEHPMSVNMVQSLKDSLKKQPTLIHSADDNGWTLLHQEAMAGSAPTVKVLLEAGADPHAKTSDGRTALQLAQSLGWENVVALMMVRK
jgi:uncharacterized protein YegJ (DUF2314 family)